ncbi:DUF58 domain-containing protein [Congregibacter variabilis]|uniref:DUF58 domain-containing protein n=1 Tax=Congregibacter variabilis TaxID=3081200 RepID=A0ABZ0I5J1_9GAMM|nr:DUF58 domain-containing protein [Congregibacter sp. IMCC43200]
MTSTWSEALSRRWSRWLDRRIPPSRSVTLSQRQIFIFPSRTGFFFALCLLVMLVAAINYQNNMSYALTFLLANLFVVAVLHTYANLAGLTISALSADEVFAGQRAGFHFRFTAGNKQGHQALSVGWPQPKSSQRRRRLFTGLFSSADTLAEEEIELEPGTSKDVVLHAPVGSRGWYRPERLRIESTFPLGLLRCWTWVALDQRALVYPAPLVSPEPVAAQGDAQDGRWLSGAGDDEFSGIRDYRQGDNPRRVYWKGLARGQSLQTKVYATAVADARWLDWEQFVGLDQERRLSALCYWVMDYHRRELEFGLRVPGTELAPASGDRQRDAALRALALYKLSDEAQVQ